MSSRITRSHARNVANLKNNGKESAPDTTNVEVETPMHKETNETNAKVSVVKNDQGNLNPSDLNEIIDMGKSNVLMNKGPAFIENQYILDSDVVHPLSIDNEKELINMKSDILSQVTALVDAKTKTHEDMYHKLWDYCVEMRNEHDELKVKFDTLNTYLVIALNHIRYYRVYVKMQNILVIKYLYCL